jgi:hypothetical protein
MVMVMVCEFMRLKHSSRMARNYTCLEHHACGCSVDDICRMFSCAKNSETVYLCVVVVFFDVQPSYAPLSLKLCARTHVCLYMCLCACMCVRACMHARMYMNKQEKACVCMYTPNINVFMQIH